MKTRRYAFALSLISLLAAAGCGNAGTDPPAPGDDTDAGVPSGPPAPKSDHPVCVLSADCPVGQYCDLGECVQACNTEKPCGEGLTCGPRGRCLPPATKDEDPKPTGTFMGSVFAPVTLFPLTDKDSTVSVKLQATHDTLIRYRVELDAPHLSIEAARGEFKGSTTLTFKVDTSKLKGQSSPGSMRVITNVGELVVNAPIKVGLSGSYHGALRYDGGAVNLGDVGFSVDLLEKAGEISVKVDAKKSVLFPATEDGEATGRGSYAGETGADITITQRIKKAVGGTRNRFQRDIGRKLRLKLKPDAKGNLSGTFEETIHGLYSTPVVLTGTVALENIPLAKVEAFTVGTDLTMPTAPATDFLYPTSVFSGWAEANCDKVVCGATTCSTGAITTAAGNMDKAYSEPLYATFGGRDAIKTTEPFGDISLACQASFKKDSVTSWAADPNAQRCGLLPAVACTLPVLSRLSVSDIPGGKALGKMTAKTITPALFVAKDEIVKALRSGIVEGNSSQRKHLDTAMTVLGPTATWVLQAGVLEHLRSLPTSAAKGDEGTDGSTITDSFPAARALADLFQTEALIDGERSRMAAMAATGEQPALAKAAQENAVITFLEAATLAELVKSWGTVPESVSTKVLGVLTPLDQGFTALSLGENVFGYPPGFVPFLWRPEDSAGKPTNFEQVHALAEKSVGVERDAELAFKANDRAYETGKFGIDKAVNDLRASYDLRLKDICGAAFDPNKVKTAADLSACGKDGTGEVGILALDVDLARGAITSNESRMRGARDKVGIDVRKISEIYKIREDNLSFISSTGAQLAGLTFATGVIDAYSGFLSTASNAQVFNAGAPVAMASAVLVLNYLKAGLEMQKSQLQTAQTMKLEASTAQIEVVTGMADVQKQTIDIAQMAVDGQQDMIRMVQAQLKLRNALSTAKGLWEERQRSLALAGRDPTADPTFRILRDASGFKVFRARFEAQRYLFLTGAALEYEINTKIPGASGAVLNAYNADNLTALHGCYSDIFTKQRFAYGTPQEYVTTVSVRKMLGILGPKLDLATGLSMTEGEQFRRMLLANHNLDGKGGIGVTFSTSLQPGNGLWSSDVCSDRIATVQAQLVGDFLGDNQAQVNLTLAGSGFQRKCDADAMEVWSLGPEKSSITAVLQAGVNTYGDAAANNTLFAQPVARASWWLVIPGPSAAPTNADVDLQKVEDVVLKIAHRALPRKSSPISVDTSCLSTIGK